MKFFPDGSKPNHTTVIMETYGEVFKISPFLHSPLHRFMILTGAKSRADWPTLLADNWEEDGKHFPLATPESVPDRRLANASDALIHRYLRTPDGEVPMKKTLH